MNGAVMEKIYNNIINLCTTYQIEDSKNWLDILCFQLETCKIELDFLEQSKPFWFQKQKLKEYKEKKDELETRLLKIKNNIEQELNLISKMLNN